MTGADGDDKPEVAWHNRTSTLLGVSAAALALIALLVGAISYVTGQAGEPEPAPTEFVEPTYSVTDRSGSTSTSTTTATITSTSPPVTTDINPETTPPTESSPGSAPSTITTRPPRTRETDNGPTTRERPRLTRRSTPSPEP